MKKRFISRASIAVLFVMLIGFSSSTFSRQFNASLGNALGLQNLGAKGVSQMFGNGKAVNMYDTALTLVKNNEVKVTFSSIDAIMNNHTEFAACNISADDVVNVLYNSNPDFRSTLELTVVNKSKKKVSVPSDADITRSYKRFLLCRKGQTDFVDISDSDDVTRQLSTEYVNPINTNFYNQTLDQVNFGDDIFQNGTLDDSDYDLLVDIDSIGKKFFESFTTPVQTLFYELPKISSLGGGGNEGGSGGPGSQPGGSFVVLSGGQIVVNNNSTGDVGTGGGDGGGGGGRSDDGMDITDPGISNFVNDNNNQTFPPNNLYALPASQCASGIASEITLPGDATLTVDEYQGYIQAAIAALNAKSEDEVPQVPSVVTGTSGTTGGSLPPGSPNERVESTVDAIGGECGQHCNGLETEGEQQNCLNECLQSCTAKCEDVSLVAATEKAYCYSQCLCFTVGGPVGEKWKGMEDMYKIKFCTIPVQAGRVTGGKKVYSIEAIFLEIKKVLDSLLNGGEIFKRTKPKEYFDTSLSQIKFQDIFSFQIVTQVKQLFPTISKSTETKLLAQTNVSYENAILGMRPDDKNKYVIISDVIGRQVDAENIGDIDEYNARIDSLKSIQIASETVLPDPVGNANNAIPANINDDVRKFMVSNLDFWNIASLTLQEINDLAGLLLKGIK